MGKSMEEAKLAVETGYWKLYRYNPDLVKERKNPFQLDCKAPTADIQEFLLGENRYASLAKKDPETAQKLRDNLAQAYAERTVLYQQLADLPFAAAEESK
jgi:pyruvate-ferredoxin/flavodoxin oxidoreductase